MNVLYNTEGIKEMSKLLKNTLTNNITILSSFKKIYNFDNRYHIFSLLSKKEEDVSKVVLYNNSSHFYAEEEKLSEYEGYRNVTIENISNYNHGLIGMNDNRSMMELVCEYQYKDKQITYNKFKYTYKLYKKHKIVGRLL